MSRRMRTFTVTAVQAKLWPRHFLEKDERARRYNNLRALGLSRAMSIRGRDLSEKNYQLMVSGATIDDQLAE